MARKLRHAGVAFAAIKEPPAIEFEMNLGWRRDSEAHARHEVLADCLAATTPTWGGLSPLSGHAWDWLEACRPIRHTRPS